MDKPDSLNLEPITRIVDREVTISEYYHAAVGSNPRTLEIPRECIAILEGNFEGGANAIDEVQWRIALEKAAEANPGARLAMSGHRRGTVWNSTGELPALRFVRNIDWDGQSDVGSEFIQATPLDFRHGPAAELIIATGAREFVILRVLHTVMDGIGIIHFLSEIFRALRDEPLEGTNTAVPDVQLMDRVRQQKTRLPKGVPAHATGGPEGEQTGDCWKAIQVRGTKSKVLARTILAVAKTAAEYSDKPVRIAIPIDLRRHFPGMRSTLNYTSMIHIDVQPDETPEAITERIKQRLDENAEAGFSSNLGFFKIIPLHWMDKLVSRNPHNYRKRRIIETALISSPGLFKPSRFTGGGFVPIRFFSVPIPGNTMISIVNLGREATITVGVEKTYASNGRLDKLLHNITEAVSR